MSSLERLMSMVAVGVGEEVAALSPEQATARIPEIATRRRARRILFKGYGRSVGGRCHPRRRVLGIPFARRSAEALVVDVSGDRGMIATDRALRIAAQPNLTEGSFERVVQEIPADERLTDAQEQLDGLRRLHRADDAGQHAEHARFGARRRELGRWWLGEEAPVARAFEGLEHGH